jgi:hypothetical protein
VYSASVMLIQLSSYSGIASDALGRYFQANIYHGARLAKIAWQQELGPDGLVHPGKFVQVELMLKSSRRYRNSQGWGWGRWRGAELKALRQGCALRGRVHGLPPADARKRLHLHAADLECQGRPIRGGEQRRGASELVIETPRDRNGSFEPQLVKKHQTRWDGFDDKILSMYARRMSVREIQGHLQEMYGVEVSPTLISVFPCASASLRWVLVGWWFCLEQA